jgi:PAS domain S-box-containing protein
LSFEVVPIAEAGYVNLYGRDITERKQAEETLRVSEEKYRLLFENANDAILLHEVSREGPRRIFAVNEATCRMLGYTREELLRMTIADIDVPEQMEKIPAILDRLFSEGCAVFETEHLRKDGSRVQVLVSIRTFDLHGTMVMLSIVRDITERKKAEELLRETTQTLEAVIKASPLPIFAVDRERIVKTWNPAAERTFGWSAQEVLGRQYPAIPKDKMDEADVLFSRALESGLSEVETLRQRQDGSLIDVHISAAPLRDGRGNVTGVMAVVADITERKRAEEKIKLFSDAVASAFDCLMLTDIKGNFTYANEAACTTFGYTPEEFLKLDITKLDADPEVGKKIAREVGTKGKWSGEVINIRKNGEAFHSLLSAFIIKDDKGNQKGTMGILRDITERKRAEEALRLSDGLVVIANRHTEMLPLLKEFVGEIRNYTGCAAVGIRLLDEEGNIPYQAYEGFSERFYQLESPLSIKSDRCMCINVIKGETDPKLPFYTQGGSFYMNGTTRFLATVAEEEKGDTRNTCNEFGYESVALIPIRLDERLLGLIHVADTRENMVPPQMVRMLEDAAMELGAAIERLKAQEALAAEKERLDVTLRSIGDGVIVADTEGKVVLMNQVAEQLTGWTFEEAAGRPLADVFHIINEDTRERCENPAERVLETGRIVGLANRTVLVSKNGIERFIADSGAPIRDAKGDALGVILVFRDMTEERRAEQELLRAEKMESVGVLAGGIAHDFNNILTLILGNISLAKTVTDAESKAFELLSHAEKACWRARDLTQQLLTFAKGGAPVRKTITLSSIIRDATAFALSGSNVRCDFSIPEGLWPVEADEGQISQVINNLVINADQAMPSGGLIRISAENVNLSPESGLPLPPGKYVRLAVRDQGIGISKEHLPKIFGPYFTTKQKGSGLGLAMAYSVVKNHDGHITAESQLGVGSTFFIHLPASEKEIAREKPLEEKSFVGQGRVLVMDDRGGVRQLAHCILTNRGYEVVVAKNGAEVIELFERAKKSRRPFHAVILDLTVPDGMGGKETIEKLLSIDPNVKAIVSSGYSDDPVMADFAKYGFSAAIAKPYGVQELAAIVHRVISGEPANSPPL